MSHPLTKIPLGPFRTACFLLALLLLAIGTATGQGGKESRDLHWRLGEGKVDANIDDRGVQSVLRDIARQTGWDVYLEPGSDHRVITRFKNKSAGEALSRILGKLNYALLPQPSGPNKLLVYLTSIAGATERIQAEDKKESGDTTEEDGAKIGNELIVTLNKDSKKSIDELAAELGARVVGRLDGLNAYRLAFDDEESANLARSLLEEDESVASLDDNYRIPRPAAPQPLSHASALPPRLKAAVPPAGSELIVGLVDMGFDAKGTRIEDFILPQIGVAGETVIPEGELSHGLAMAETILRGLEIVDADGNSTLRIQPVDVYGPNANTTTYDVAAGIAEAVKQGARIINLSLGGADDSPFMGRLIQDYYDEGILFVGAAGNYPVAAPSYPSAFEPVISVTSGDRQGNLSSYANFSPTVDVIAPGGSIVHDNQNRAFFGNGTSFSAAYISGVAGGMTEAGKEASQVEQQIRETFKFEKKE